MRKFSTMLAVLVLAGCTSLESDLPVLGMVENGIYTQPDGAFACPVPGPGQGFRGAVRIRDAAELVETRQRVIPVDERKPWDPQLRNEIVYPIKVVASHIVRFTDEADPKRFLEVQFRPMRPVDTAEAVYGSGYGGGNYGLLREAHRDRDGLEYGMAVLQLPYFVKGRGYMGMDLWEMYLNGDDPGPDIDVVFNVIHAGQHVSILLHTSSLEFLPEDVNPKDLMTVNAALKSDPDVLDTVEDRLFTLVAQCRFSPID